MKPFVDVFTHSYKTYLYDVAEYVKREEGDRLADLYSRGFLPYSGNKDISGVYYRGRSARLPLVVWEPNSENRRILKRFHDREMVRTLYPTHTFPYRNNPDFLQFCAEYFLVRHGENTMPVERVQHVLENFVTHIVEYRTNGARTAIVFLAQDDTLCHFMFSFYDLSLVRHSLGMWLMLDAIIHAQKESKEYFYLGTVYGEKGRYKMNFDSLEFWDDVGWNRDMCILKKLYEKDVLRTSNKR